MNPIDVIPGDHIQNHAQRVVLHILFSGVEPQLSAVGSHQVRTGFADVGPGNGRKCRDVPGAIRIEPSVKFQPATMGFLDGKGQGIIERGRGLPHFAGQILRPGFNSGLIERVACGAHVEENGVQMALGGDIHQRNELGLLLSDRQSWLGRPIDVLESGHPGGSKFPFRLRRGQRRGRVHFRGAKRLGQRHEESDKKEDRPTADAANGTVCAGIHFWEGSSNDVLGNLKTFAAIHHLVAVPANTELRGGICVCLAPGQFLHSAGLRRLTCRHAWPAITKIVAQRTS
jgi:hypothetical protein